MVFFITVLKVLAACLITNSHYTGIYPTDLIANGGLIGDILFFAVSGYCLYNPKGSFLKWYKNRLIRCYLPVWVITALYMVLGFYDVSVYGFTWWYVFPTYYHFVASIILLYVPFYFVVKSELLRKHIPLVMAAVFVVYSVFYIFGYDKSYYHIDTVREPMIRFLFFESMLLGAWFRESDTKFRNQFTWWQVCGVLLTFIAYFVSKLLFARYTVLSNLQIVNQLLIFALLYFLMRLFSGLDNKLEHCLKGKIRELIECLSKLTLEIYVVQYVLIDLIRPLIGFPANWIILTGSIIVAAALLHLMCDGIRGLANKAARSICGT